MKEFAGRVTVVLTPELRALALAEIDRSQEGANAEDLKNWFTPEETRDGYLLDAAYSEAEALMILMIVQALVWKFE